MINHDTFSIPPIIIPPSCWSSTCRKTKWLIHPVNTITHIHKPCITRIIRQTTNRNSIMTIRDTTTTTTTADIRNRRHRIRHIMTINIRKIKIKTRLRNRHRRRTIIRSYIKHHWKTIFLCCKHKRLIRPMTTIIRTIHTPPIHMIKLSEHRRHLRIRIIKTCLITPNPLPTPSRGIISHKTHIHLITLLILNKHRQRWI